MTDELIPTRASDWMILLKEDPADAEMARRFRQWLDESPDHVRDWTEITHTYDLIGKTLPVHAAQWRPTLPVAPVWRRHAVSAGLLAAAAACLVAVAPVLSLHLQSDYVTGTAQTRTVALADGTQVYMGPKTALAVDYSGKDRRVRLLKGEAFFEVTPNPDRPFRVATRRIETRVLGTAFDVHMRGDGTEVRVQHGHVRVGQASVSADLLAGDGVRMSWNGRTTPVKTLPDQVAVWRRGEMIAKDATVAEVIADLRPYHDGLILVSGDALAAKRVTGIYRLTDPEGAVEAVALAQGAKVRHVTPWITVLAQK